MKVSRYAPQVEILVTDITPSEGLDVFQALRGMYISRGVSYSWMDANTAKFVVTIRPNTGLALAEYQIRKLIESHS